MPLQRAHKSSASSDIGNDESTLQRSPTFHRPSTVDDSYKTSTDSARQRRSTRESSKSNKVYIAHSLLAPPPVPHRRTSAQVSKQQVFSMSSYIRDLHAKLEHKQQQKSHNQHQDLTNPSPTPSNLSHSTGDTRSNLID